LEFSDLESNLEFCPNCGTNLQGPPIPRDKWFDYGATHFSRKIGIYDYYKDREVAWQCPDCGERFPIE
jgi:predicted RNA-binding Zn-ribbon protein involved in translation (DUF1610 family)